VTSASHRADDAALLALSHLPGLGPARGRWLLGGMAGPAEVVARLGRGALPDGVGPPPRGVTERLVEQWRRALAELDVAACWQAHRDAGLELLTPGHPSWPFADDPEPPLVLWARGRLDLLERVAAVAVVGSRRCSNVGARVALGLGADLAEAGVVVVSGLAAGIDAAAHRGALGRGGDVIGVVGTGADVVYPASSARLWDQVAADGLLVGEAPLGSEGQRWRFPARNRLIAALSRVVVVVESHASGGALHTVAEAERRQRAVLAVPGSVLSPASAGTNRLLFDGAGVARSAIDVLGVLGLEAPVGPLPDGTSAGGRESDVDVVLRELAAGPARLDSLLPGRPLAEVVVVVQRLVATGLVEVEGGTVVLGRR
jgi:DNA processing protein